MIDSAYEADLQEVENHPGNPVSEDFFKLDIADEHDEPIINEDRIKRSKDLQYLLIMLSTGAAVHVLHRD